MGGRSCASKSGASGRSHASAYGGVAWATSTEDAGIHQGYREAGAVAVFAKQNAVQLREYLRALLVSA
jgi:hypothetical protein